jgi:hypothetical protein
MLLTGAATGRVALILVACIFAGVCLIALWRR